MRRTSRGWETRSPCSRGPVHASSTSTSGDGDFIPEITVGPIVLASIAPLARGWGVALDCHLMVSAPEKHFEAVAKAGGASVTFHVEACDKPGNGPPLATRELGLGVGDRVQPRDLRRGRSGSPRKASTSSSACPSIPATPGRSSCPSPSSASNVFASFFPEDVRVQVDGGINRRRRSARRGGGGRRTFLVAGSAIFWRDDPAAAYRELAVLEREAPASVRGRWLRRSRCSRSTSSEGAFAELEEWLLAQGFFASGGEGPGQPTSTSATGSRRSSAATRRRRLPSPARCRSPPAAFALRRADRILSTQSRKGFVVGCPGTRPGPPRNTRSRSIASVTRSRGATSTR